MMGAPTRAAVSGLIAGFMAALAMVLLAVLLRLLLGIPLLVELASDRIIPTLSIGEFQRLAGGLGGLIRGKEIAFISSFILQVGLATLAGIVAGIVQGGRPERRRVSTLATASVLGLAAIATVLLLWPVLASNYRGVPPGRATVTNVLAIVMSFALYGVVLWLALRALSRIELEADADEVQADGIGGVFGRRAFLLGGAGIGLAALTGGLVDLLYRRATVGPNGYDGLRVGGPQTDPITPNDRFYVVTKNLIDPTINRDVWRLELSGLVERPHTLRFEELTALPSSSQLLTLECISNGVGGGLMSNAEWKGVPMPTILALARPRPEGRFVRMHAADGYVHVVPVDLALRPSTLVAYEMNGEPLPHRHGYPARVLVPGTYGEVSVKWVDRIEVLDHPDEGYYESQGWQPWFVHITSRFDRPRNRQSISLSAMPEVPVNGVAFAGDRGVSKVEISADGGSTWEEMGIDYGPTPLTWSLWSGTWSPPSPGRYTLRVRATDGTGALQIAEERGIAPSGATGYHEIEVEVTP